MITNFTLKTSLLSKNTDKAMVKMFRDFLMEINLALQNKLRNTVDSKAKTFENYYSENIENASSICFKSNAVFRFCQHPQQGEVIRKA